MDRHLLSPFAADGRTDTGKGPVLSICSSMASCSIFSNSVSKSPSSIASPRGLLEIAVAISSAITCCSRIISLWAKKKISSALIGTAGHASIYQGKVEAKRRMRYTHCRIDFFRCKAIMDFSHSSTSFLHRSESLVIDIRSLNRVNVLFYLRDLILGHLQMLLEYFLSPEGGLGS